MKFLIKINCANLTTFFFGHSYLIQALTSLTLHLCFSFILFSIFLLFIFFSWDQNIKNFAVIVHILQILQLMIIINTHHDTVRCWFHFLCMWPKSFLGWLWLIALMLRVSLLLAIERWSDTKLRFHTHSLSLSLALCLFFFIICQNKMRAVRVKGACLKNVGRKSFIFFADACKNISFSSCATYKREKRMCKSVRVKAVSGWDFMNGNQIGQIFRFNIRTTHTPYTFQQQQQQQHQPKP